MRIATLLLLLACGLGAASWPGSATLDAILEQAVENGTIPGGVLLVGQGDRILHHKAYGLRATVPEQAPARLDTIYDCASLTKVVVTAPAVMMLVEQGKVRLDDRVTRYLPEFRKGESRITVRQLLTHYSGLRPDVDLEPAWSGYETGIAKAYSEVPIAKPNERFIYSDINYILLAELVHAVSGMRIDEFARERILGPLEMRDAQFNPAASLAARIAPTEHLPDGTLLHGVVHDPTTRFMGGVAGHAGLFATAADLSRYVRMVLHGGELDGAHILSPLGLAAMTRPQSPEGKPARGLGWDIDSPYASPRGDLFDRDSFGHTGFTGTSIWVDPPSETYVILMTNRVHPRPGRGSVVSLRSRVASAVAAAISSPAATLAREPSQAVLTGLDVLVAESFQRLAGKKIGLITNHTGIDRKGRSNVELISESPRVELAAILAPEHGFAGKLDHEEIEDAVDGSTGTKVFSLYQGSRRRPTPEMLAGLDALVFDIQDIGARFYTYATTLAYCLEEAAKVGLPVYVLDRPNPITGVRLGGPVLDAGLESFIGYLPGMPVQHGMTIGELALLFNREKRIGADVHVVKMQGWRREMWFDQTGLPWVNPSPNIRSLTQAVLYPGVALLEGLTNYSVGRGTDAPFQFVGAEWMDAAALADDLRRDDLSDAIRPYATTRTPDSSKLAGTTIPGLWLDPADRDRFDSLEFGLHLAAAIAQRHGEHINWTQTAKLVGDRETLEEWKEGVTPSNTWKRWLDEGRAFGTKRASVLLY